MAISSIGVGSGLPLDELLEQLRTAENQSLALIQTRATKEQSRLSAYGTIKGSIEALKTASDALAKAETFGALKTSVSGDGFTASATSKAIAGQYNIEVDQLATAQTLTSAGHEKRDEAFVTGNGSVVIKITLADNTTKELTIDATDSSLEGIVKAINEDSSLGVSATLVNDGSANPHRFLLTAKNTGDKGAVQSITFTGADGADASPLQAALGFTQGADATTTTDNVGGLAEIIAKNAKLTINGTISVEKQTNTIEGAIEGVTLTLTKETEAGKPSTLAVTRDDSVTSKAINTFVTAYNNLQNIIKTLTSYNVDNQTGSALTGDSLARSVQSQVRDALNVAESSGAIRTLSQLGITTSPTDGTLKVDDTKLSAALKDSMVDVEKLFSGENGLSAKLAAVANTYVKSDGMITTAANSITENLKDLEDQYDATSARIDAKMENYRQQFIKLDATIAQMNSTSSYLTQQLAMLGNIGEEK